MICIILACMVAFLMLSRFCFYKAYAAQNHHPKLLRVLFWPMPVFWAIAIILQALAMLLRP